MIIWYRWAISGEEYKGKTKYSVYRSAWDEEYMRIMRNIWGIEEYKSKIKYNVDRSTWNEEGTCWTGASVLSGGSCYSIEVFHITYIPLLILLMQ